MRKTHLLGLGGALLASTALSDAAQAGTFQQYSQQLVATATLKPTAGFTAAKIAAQLFGGTGYSASQTIGPQYVFVNLSNSYASGLGPKINVAITGASFDTTALNTGTSAALTLVNTQSGATINSTTSGAGAGCVIGILTTQIQLTNCLTGVSSATFSGIALSGLIYTGATALVTAGTSISLSGTVVEQASQSNTYETLTAATVVTSQNIVAVTATSGTATVLVGVGATAYTSVSQTVSGATSAGLTVILTQIAFTGTGAVYSDLTSTGATTNMIGNMGLSVTAAALSDPAVSNVRFVTGNGTTVFTATVASGAVTFAASDLTGARLFPAAGSGTNYLQIEYNGTTAIAAAAAGTTTATFTANVTTSGTAWPTTSGTASAIARASFTVQVNSVQPSTNTVVTSYIRITNGSTIAGIPTITVYNASTGAALGTYTTASVPGLATLQLTAKDIETGAGITANASGYDLIVGGNLPSGYVQHVTGNPGNMFVDFSGRRTSNLGVN